VLLPFSAEKTAPAMLKQFKALADLYRTFSDSQVALDHFKSIRWRNVEFCPYCGHDKVYTLKANRYQCAYAKTRSRSLLERFSKTRNCR
jgi:hypothetical protein